MMMYLIIAQVTLLATTTLPPWNRWEVYRGEFINPWLAWATLFGLSLLWPLWLALAIGAMIKGALDAGKT